jgi:hypothetical protein
MHRANLSLKTHLAQTIHGYGFRLPPAIPDRGRLCRNDAIFGLAEASANQHILAAKINEIITIKQDRRENYYDWQAI